MAEAECALCGLSIKQYLARCTECKRWFCNQKLKGDKMSHVCQHIKQQRHVVLDIPYNKFETPLECCICRTRNIAKLMFKQSDDVNASGVLVVCGAEECQLNDAISKWHDVYGTYFFDRDQKMLHPILMPVPQQGVLTAEKELRQMDRAHGSMEAHNIDRIQRQKKLNEEVIIDINDQQYDQQLKQLIKEVQHAIVLPVLFNKSLNSLQLVNGRPAITAVIRGRQYDIDGTNVISNDEQVQQEINRAQEIKINYYTAFIRLVCYEYQYNMLINRQGQHEIPVEKVYYRMRDYKKHILILGWDSTTRVAGQRVKTMDQIDVFVQRLSGKVTSYVATAQVSSEGLKLLLDDDSIVMDNENIMRVIKMQDEEGGPALKLTEQEEDRPYQLQLFKNYEVRQFLDDTCRIYLRQSSNKTLVDRMKAALRQASNSQVQLYRLIIGDYNGMVGNKIIQLNKVLLPDINMARVMEQLQCEIEEKGLIMPNQSQKDAIQHCVQNCLSIVQGCPGGGKTFTAVYMMRAMQLAYSACGETMKILCCTGSNVAADNIAMFTLRMGLNIIRIYSKTIQQNMHNYVGPKEIQEYSLLKAIERKLEQLEYIGQEELSDVRKEAISYFMLGSDAYEDWFRKQQDEIKQECQQHIIEKLYSQIEGMCIGTADIVICTCATSGDERLCSRIFDAVIIDESSQSVEPEQMIAITHTQKQVVIIGDDRQLGPVVAFQELRKTNYYMPLYTRLTKMGVQPHSLNIQYRMHQGLLEFPNMNFYEGIIKQGINSDERRLEAKIADGRIARLIRPDFPSIFVNVQGIEQSVDTSYKNIQEAALVVQLINMLQIDYKNVRATDIGIITPYVGQQDEIYRRVQHEAVEVNSVDGFQGREKEIIIVSCVRGNDDGTVGFLNDWRRINVSFTRARRLLIIVGNARTLVKNKTWSNIIKFYFKKGAVYGGDEVNNLQKEIVANFYDENE